MTLLSRGLIHNQTTKAGDRPDHLICPSYSIRLPNHLLHLNMLVPFHSLLHHLHQLARGPSGRAAFPPGLTGFPLHCVHPLPKRPLPLLHIGAYLTILRRPKQREIPKRVRALRQAVHMAPVLLRRHGPHRRRLLQAQRDEPGQHRDLRRVRRAAPVGTERRLGRGGPARAAGAGARRPASFVRSGVAPPPHHRCERLERLGPAACRLEQRLPRGVQQPLHELERVVPHLRREVEHAQAHPFRGAVGVRRDLRGGEGVEYAEEGGAHRRGRVGDQREELVEEGVRADRVIGRAGGELGGEMGEGLTPLLVGAGGGEG